ncbi:MAG: DUF615 domain-containing protein [Gammaproteobacteria bacterium]|nr:DUF615 domain-containing protein [Gammaproteobacteria bacterium]NNC77962.1 DUF615 domain-containing protein [Woeseiaceae bacterium]
MTESKPSKSERKRRQLALQSLGEQLIGLSDELLAELTLDERLLDAISAAQRMKSHEAVRRQKQYIGKLMRDVDAAPIQALLDRLRADDRREKRIFANAERWRDQLARDPGAGLSAFEAETGSPQPGLADILNDLKTAHSDRSERELRRQLFREIHQALVTTSSDG